MEKKLKIGIVGCGAIGSQIARACMRELKSKIELTAIYDIDKEKATSLSRITSDSIVVKSLEELIDRVDLIVESASGSVSASIAEKAIERSKDILIMSTGGLIDSEELLERARKKNVRLFFPSGAICGIDGLKAAKAEGIETVTLTTTKAPRSLEGAPYFKENNIDVYSIKAKTVIYDGNAKGAIKGFPKNVNVASLLSMVGIGAEKTKVIIIADPNIARNMHEIEISGKFGTLKTRTENVPSLANPKTSKLAFLSAIALLRDIADSVKFGT